MTDRRDGFTLPDADVEAAIGRGVARALGLPLRVVPLGEVAPEDCPVCLEAARARREAEVHGGDVT